MSLLYLIVGDMHGVAHLSSRCAELYAVFFFLMIRRPPRSTLDRSSAASDVYKRQIAVITRLESLVTNTEELFRRLQRKNHKAERGIAAVSYTHLRAHETVLDLVCRLLLEKKKNTQHDSNIVLKSNQSQKV